MKREKSIEYLNKCHNKIYSWREILILINKFLKENISNYFKKFRHKCSFKYITNFSLIITDENDLTKEKYRYTSDLYECSVCYKRKITGDYDHLKKTQKDFLNMWLNHEVEL